jgi:hypothetical protein
MQWRWTIASDSSSVPMAVSNKLVQKIRFSSHLGRRLRAWLIAIRSISWLEKLKIAALTAGAIPNSRFAARGKERPSRHVSIKISRISDAAFSSLNKEGSPCGREACAESSLARLHHSGDSKFKLISSTGQRPARSHALSSTCTQSSPEP